jgi:glycosyltransferase involved in cell wall biosynthesis
MNLFYISTNSMWSGSEILWYESARDLLSKGNEVAIATKYDHPKINEIKRVLSAFVDLRNRYSTLSSWKKYLNSIHLFFFEKDTLKDEIVRAKPDLIIVSQGDIISSADIFELCIGLNVRFITITQLVCDVHWLWLNDDLQKRLKAAYQKAIKNFFVSQDNLKQHKFIFAYPYDNTELIFNPSGISEQHIAYPKNEKRYSIAFVGRIECFHKGLDILIKVLNSEKWKCRPVEFNFYGKGPHYSIIEQQLTLFQIDNVHLKGYTDNITEVWENNQLLIMPSRMEGQSLALIEASCCNRGAVVTNVGGVAEIVENNRTGFIAKEPTPESLDEAMERAWNERDNWEFIGLAAGRKIRESRPSDAVQYFNKNVELLAGI